MFRTIKSSSIPLLVCLLCAVSCSSQITNAQRVDELKQRFAARYPNGFRMKDGWYELDFSFVAPPMKDFPDMSKTTGVCYAKLAFSDEWEEDNAALPPDSIGLRCSILSMEYHVSWNDPVDVSVGEYRYVEKKEEQHAYFDGEFFYLESCFFGKTDTGEWVQQEGQSYRCGGKNTKPRQVFFPVWTYPLYHSKEWDGSDKKEGPIAFSVPSDSVLKAVYSQSDDTMVYRESSLDFSTPIGQTIAVETVYSDAPGWDYKKECLEYLKTYSMRSASERDLDVPAIPKEEPIDDASDQFFYIDERGRVRTTSIGGATN